MSDATAKLDPTPSQTVGPFFGYGLPFPGGGDVAPAGHPDAVTVHGFVYDGEGLPIPDAVMDFWQAAPGWSAREDASDTAFDTDHVAVATHGAIAQ